MSNTQLKIRIRLDQTADHPILEQDLPEHPEASSESAPHPVYVYNWPRIIGVFLALLFILTALFLAISDWISGSKESVTNSAETTSSSLVGIDATSLTESAQSVPPAAEPSFNQSSGNNPIRSDKPVDEYIELKLDVKDTPRPLPDSASPALSEPPVKPGIKPGIAAFQPKEKATLGISHSAGLVKAQLTSNIHQRAPVDDIDKISLAGKPSRPIFLFLHFNKFRDKKVFVNWYYRDKRVARITLPVGNNDWRTYSSKILTLNRLGSWHVTVENQSGKSLAKFEFSVTR